MPFRAAQRAVGGALFAVAGCALAALAACQTEAVGIETCRKVESTRCDRAIECGIDLSRLGSANNVEGCKRYYLDACLHGRNRRRSRKVNGRVGLAGGGIPGRYHHRFDLGRWRFCHGS